MRDADSEDVLFAQVDGLVIEEVELGEGRVRVVARAVAAQAVCPHCGEVSGRVHSGYERRLADMAVGGRPVVIRRPPDAHRRTDGGTGAVARARQGLCCCTG
ncbi:transposase family protein [Streptomyces sp. NPDC058676]|uniref:transposase family protein n=1 Tax=unclassified Streptomyces TaxID=2593676 RepID=UPI00365B72E2